MELIVNEEKRKIYQQDNKFYTLLDMGNHVGYKSRRLFEEAEAYWVLMHYEDRDNNIKIVSLVSEEGLYMRFLMEKNNVRRCIHLHNCSVYSDSINVINNDKKYFDLGTKYTALDKQCYDDNQKPLLQYLNENPIFYSRHGEIFDEDYVTNDVLVEFLLKNKELVDDIQKENESIQLKLSR